MTAWLQSRRVSMPRPTEKYRPSCSSRAADGFIRGGLVGLAWGAYFHPLDELVATGWIQPSPQTNVANSINTELKSNPPRQNLNKNKLKQLHQASKVVEDSASSPIRRLAIWTQRSVTPRLKSMGQASLMFGCFLGTFSGVTCATERLTSSRHWGCVFVGGFAAGALLAARSGSRSAILVTALGTGALTSALHSASNF